jgi:hypothetical protein
VEARVNRFPQYRTEIDGVGVHQAVQRSAQIRTDRQLVEVRGAHLAPQHHARVEEEAQVS